MLYLLRRTVIILASLIVFGPTSTGSATTITLVRQMNITGINPTLALFKANVHGILIDNASNFSEPISGQDDAKHPVKSGNSIGVAKSIGQDTFTVYEYIATLANGSTISVYNSAGTEKLELDVISEILLRTTTGTVEATSATVFLEACGISPGPSDIRGLLDSFAVDIRSHTVLSVLSLAREKSGARFMFLSVDQAYTVLPSIKGFDPKPRRFPSTLYQLQ
jgi:hypothetical protein